MKLEFKISKIELVNYIFSCKKNPFKSWVNLEEHLFNNFKNEPAYYFLNTIHYNWAFGVVINKTEQEGFKNVFSEVGEKIEEIYKEIFKSKEFKKIYFETEDYKKWLEKEWNKNEKFIFNYFKNALGLKIPDYKIQIHVFHPKLFRGNSNFTEKIIQWGHSEDWENYSVVYLAHELLHIIADRNFTKTMHAIIELATDNELRIQLNKDGEYFKEGKEDIGHPSLRKLEKKILPCWKEFLDDRKGKNIIDLEKSIRPPFGRGISLAFRR